MQDRTNNSRNRLAPTQINQVQTEIEFDITSACNQKTIEKHEFMVVSSDVACVVSKIDSKDEIVVKSIWSNYLRWHYLKMEQVEIQLNLNLSTLRQNYYLHDEIAQKKEQSNQVKFSESSHSINFSDLLSSSPFLCFLSSSFSLRTAPVTHSLTVLRCTEEKIPKIAFIVLARKLKNPI